MSETLTLLGGDGSMTLSTTGARVLDCRLPNVESNLFYENDEGTGGDRLWIAPEVAYFWPSLEKARLDPIKYAHIPTQIDPGNYGIVDEHDRWAKLVGAMELTDARNGASLTFDVERTFAIAPRPELADDGLTHVGFSTTNDLSLRHGDPGAVAGAWSLLQVPLGGTIFCPTNRRAEPTCYFNPFGDKHVVVDDRCVRFLVDGKHRIKMGLAADTTTGRMAYYRRVDGVATLIVRLFSVSPGEPYADVPMSFEPTRRFYHDALQTYNDDGTYGGFGELEHHDPAMVVDQTVPRRVGTSVTHVVAGPDDAVRAFGAALLGVPIEPIADA